MSALPNDTEIIIVTGLPRSGTSLVMQMLVAGGVPVMADGLRKPDTDNPNGYFELQAVKEIRRSSLWLDEATGKAIKIIYRLTYYLPPRYRYRVLLVQRNLAEVVASQSAMLRRNRAAASDIPNARLIELFQDELSRFQTWLQQQKNISTLHLWHDRLLSEPLKEAMRMREFIGRGDVKSMASIIDGTLYRQRYRLNTA
ncbi:MAG: sulfotransferase [Acidobacteriia bacterium]|nr:sulfotransferase [Terriglobia bacterium]